MPYKYVAFTAAKEVLNGTLPAISEDAAFRALEQAGLHVLSLRKIRQWRMPALLPRLVSIKSRDMVLFSRQLSMLLESGVGFLDALRLSRDQTANPGLRAVLGKVILDVRAGNPFSVAAAKHPRVFKPAYCRMLRVGEETGGLEPALKHMARDTERAEAVKKKVREATFYPVLVLVISVIAVAILVTTVMPPLVRLFSELGAELPWPTRMVMGSMRILSSYKLVFAGVLTLVPLAVSLYSRRPAGRYQVERAALKLPLVGRVLLVRNMFEFSRIMSMLMEAGIPLLDMVAIASQSVQSRATQVALEQLPAELRRGQSLSQAMARQPYFPEMLLHIVATGEETNSLGRSFAAIADHYETEFSEALGTLTEMLGPVLMLGIGLAIGFIAVSVILPIYSVYGLV